MDEEFLTFFSNKDNFQDFLPNFIELEEIIGRGGQGIVYKGALNKKVIALKIYNPNQDRKRIEREVEALLDISCPNIVSIYWSNFISIGKFRVFMLATDFISGVALNELIDRNEVSFELIRKILFDVSQVIISLWEKRIVHRDLKPSNLMVNPRGRIYVIDFGFARHQDLSSITPIGYTCGTRGYLSPEQYAGSRQLTCKSDIFSLGIIILECLAGKHPTNFDQDNLLDMIKNNGFPEIIQGFVYKDLVLNMLQLKPTLRPKPEEIIEIISIEN
jgi:serine/threonine-protein kinase